MTLAPQPADPGRPEPIVEVVRSGKRRRTVSARRDGDRIVVLVPAGMPRAQEQRLVEDMVARLVRRETRTRVGDVELIERAAALSSRFLEGRAKPTSVRWVTNQNSRWGSCTPADGTIRLSHKLREMPPWVIDYVLVHELAHLLVHGHGPRFWQLVEAYPRTERARGFLEGAALAAGLDLAPDVDGEGEDEDEDEPDPGRPTLAAGDGPAA
jgi:predicted metal-dependent hydrolase